MPEPVGDWRVVRLHGPRPVRLEGTPPWERVRAVTWWCAEGGCDGFPDEGSDWCPAHRCTCLICDVVIEDGEDYCLAHEPADGTSTP
jgi:hypothetical protein